MKKKAEPLLDAIERRLLEEHPNRKRIWFDSLPPEVQQDISIARDKYRRGEYANSRSHIAKVIADVAGQHINPKPSEGAVERWLQKD